jgi:hypothetical protein
MTSYWCFHCYALNPRPEGPCICCGCSVDPPHALTYEERLIWALGHPDGDRALVAAKVLGARRAECAVPALRKIVEDGQDPFLAVAALRSVIAIVGAHRVRAWLGYVARGDSFMVRAVAQDALACTYPRLGDREPSGT